jgi:branched-chain amino acid transport system substrate-binding protein
MELVSKNTPEIHLGVVSSGLSGDGFQQGLELALAEINAQGGVLGRQLVVHYHVSGGDLHKARKIADKLANDPRIRVVIGRDTSVATIPVSTVYESTNIVYLTVSATSNSVIRYGMRFIFRLTPNNDNFAAALLKFCSQLNYKNIALLYSRDSYSESLAYAFRDYIVNNNLKIVYEKSFFDKQENFVDIAVDLKQIKPDAIFIATRPTTTANVITDLREMKIEVPVIGSDVLDNPLFVAQVGEKGNGLIIPTIYNPFSLHSENAEFSLAFHQRYGIPPDTWAAQGYDALKLLAHIMGKEILSTVPTNIATGLRYMSPRTGVTGTQVFLASGESLNKSIFFKELQSEEFLLFKDKKQEEEQTQQVDIVDNRIIRHPEKPSESTEAMTIF